MHSFAQTLVTLPDPLKVAIAAGVLYLVRLALAGRVPDEFLSELAVTISTALITSIELGLGLIPPEFQAVANAVLLLIVTLLGVVTVARVYLTVRLHMLAQGFRS